MKSLDELRAIRERAKESLDLRKGEHHYRVVVGMGTCGIAAGARKVMEAILSEIQSEEIENIAVSQTGCIGICRLEPLVEIYDPAGNKVTYVHMDEKKARRVVMEHLKHGHILTELTLADEI